MVNFALRVNFALQVNFPAEFKLTIHQRNGLTIDKKRKVNFVPLVILQIFY